MCYNYGMVNQKENSFLRRRLVSLMVILCVVPLVVNAQDSEDASDIPEGYIYEWSTNVAEAIEESQPSEDEAGKYVFVYFAGSDWCPHCMRFEKEVIDAPTFRRYLERNFVPVLIDSPRHYQLSEEQRVYNEASLAEYEVRGFPTIVIVDSDGETVAALGYNREGANGFIKALKKALP